MNQIGYLHDALKETVEDAAFDSRAPDDALASLADAAHRRGDVRLPSAGNGYSAGGVTDRPGTSISSGATSTRRTKPCPTAIAEGLIQGRSLAAF